MKLPCEAIEEFQNLWAQTTGEVLRNEEATIQAQKFLIALESIFNNDKPSLL